MSITPVMLPSSIWARCQGPLLSRTVSRILLIAVEEWARFGFQIVVGDKVLQQGGKEHRRGYYKRVGTYWREGTGHGYDGKDREEYWSSAFICWVMQRAGVLPSEFPFSRRHSKYIHHAIQNRQQRLQGAAFRGWRLDEYAPKVGDLVCYTRSPWMTGYDKAKAHDQYSAHGDIVVHVEPRREIWAIGGNVKDSVSLRIIKTDSRGRLDPKISKDQDWFCVIENRLPRD